MKKFFKWVSIGILVLVIIIVTVIIGIFIAHDRYWYYATGGKLTKLQASYDVLFYDINLAIDSEEQSIEGFTNVTFKCLSTELDTIELDLIDNFEISKIIINGKESEFDHNDDKIFVYLTNPIKLNELTTLNIYYSGQPIEALMPPWIGGFNWSEDKNGNDWIGVSSQGEGGRIWFPCKAHLSDKPDSVALNITVPEEYFVASNGILKNISIPNKGFKTYHWLTKYPISNYNVSINIAKYRSIEKNYSSRAGGTFPVIYYYLNGPEKMADSLVNMSMDMLSTFEKYFGEYPFANEKFGLAETSYLGMEHQTINSYGNKYRFKTRGHLKFDLLMLHEMAHEWWGNKVTVHDWADFWIHEGIGTYSEALYLLNKIGEEGYHEHMAGLRRNIKNNSPIQMPKFSNSWESYSGDIYNKGAYFLHSLRYILGDSLFFPTIYFFATDSNYIYQNLVDTDDFLKLVNKNSGKDYSVFFNMYLRTTNLPNMIVDSLGNNLWNVSLSYTGLELPMDIELDGKIIRKTLKDTPLQVESQSRVIVDPNNWYLHAEDFKNN